MNDTVFVNIAGLRSTTKKTVKKENYKNYTLSNDRINDQSNIRETTYMLLQPAQNIAMTMNLNTKNFHSLIEISVKLNKAIKAQRKLSTPLSRKEKMIWEQKLNLWIEHNYEDPGIIKESEYWSLMNDKI